MHTCELSSIIIDIMCNCYVVCELSIPGKGSWSVEFWPDGFDLIRSALVSLGFGFFGRMFVVLNFVE